MQTLISSRFRTGDLKSQAWAAFRMLLPALLPQGGLGPRSPEGK